MKICPACGEVYRSGAVRCDVHDVALQPWSGTYTRLDTTAIDRHVPALAAPFEPDSGRRTPPSRGRVLSGRYQLEGQLGVGGCGAVFAAQDLMTRERVAIKVLTPAAAQCAEMSTRFHREAIAASRANHPHIVEVIDFDVDDDGCHYIVMEYLDGRDLAAVIEESGRLPPARALAIAAQCASGLAAAHRVGVLHRDLKPANVFLVRPPAGEPHGVTAKIIDFGISKLTRAAGDYTNVTSASKVVGTPFYMSPEQARGEELDARSDVYALGVVLYEMLVGERPFTGRSPIEILARHCRAPRDRPSAVHAELAAFAGLDELVLRALHPHRDQRFGSMDELGAALAACLLAAEPLAAEIHGELTPRDLPLLPSPPAPRWRRGSARHLGLGLCAVTLVAAVAALATIASRDARSGHDARVAPAARTWRSMGCSMGPADPAHRGPAPTPTPASPRPRLPAATTWRAAAAAAAVAAAAVPAASSRCPPPR